ncbi:regulator of cell cycle RGCC-like [Ascaphus truei]|uniref:regulator of cell cycle RGCC-like n=1 Tax=Ascaphus truei TaxID=8439 RepID=UPI003F59D9AB
MGSDYNICQCVYSTYQKGQQYYTGLLYSMDRRVPLGEDLAHTLREFDDALQDFERGPCDYGERLEQLKRRQPGSCDSGISDLESGSSSQGSSLSTSEENLNHSTTTPSHRPKAKLGDTRELENLIADLDKVLEDL